MKYIARLFSKYTKKSQHFTEEELIEGDACPNCWGYSAYDGDFIEFYEDQTRSNVNKDPLHKKAFIQQFVETNISGIHLQTEGEHKVCPTCKARYKHKQW